MGEEGSRGAFKKMVVFNNKKCDFGYLRLCLSAMSGGNHHRSLTREWKSHQSQCASHECALFGDAVAWRKSGLVSLLSHALQLEVA